MSGFNKIKITICNFVSDDIEVIFDKTLDCEEQKHYSDEEFTYFCNDFLKEIVNKLELKKGLYEAHIDTLGCYLNMGYDFKVKKNKKIKITNSVILSPTEIH